MSVANVVGTILRFFCFKLDEIVFKFIGTVYGLLIDIAQTSLFSEDVFSAFSTRVYGILGIFMLFKVSFSVLTYIVNPDDFTDKNKGFSKLISNILITLVLLVTTPWVFTQAMDLQRIILRDNVLGKIILGSSDSTSSSSAADPGKLMAYETLTAFYHINVDTYPTCQEFVYGTESKATTCLDSIDGLEQDEKDAYSKTLEYAKATKGVGIYFDWDLVFAKDADGNFIMEYTPLFSTLAGGAIVLILLGFCIDVAVRSVKLGFMRLIAPIPIISRVDPKKGKEVFDKWVKNCMSIYVDLFVRLIAIYFSVFVITQLLTSTMTNAVTGSSTNISWLVKVFIILGALMFAKQLPKLLEDILGNKLSGSFALNPLKKLGQVPGVGGVAGGLAGAATGVSSKLAANRQLGHSGWRTAGSTALGAFSGAARGAKAGAKYDGKGKLFEPAMSAASMGAKSVYKNEGSTLGGRIGAGLQQSIGVDTRADVMEKQVKALDTYAGFKKQLKDQSDYDGTNLQNNIDIRALAQGNQGLFNAAKDGTKGLKQYYEDLQKSGDAKSGDITLARQTWEKAQQITIESGNDQINAIKGQAARFVNENQDVFDSRYSTNPNATYREINDGYVAAANESVSVKSSAQYQTAQANKTASAPSGKK